MPLIEETEFPDWLFLLSGTKSLIQMQGAAIADGPLEPIFTHFTDRWATLHSDHIPPSREQAVLDELEEGLLGETAAQDNLRIYRHCLRELRGQFHAFSTHSRTSVDISEVFIWIFEVIDDFFPLLKTPTQTAVVIFAYFCVLLKKLEFHCWLEGWADHLARRVRQLVDKDHERWIRWPLAEMGHI